MKRLVSMLFCFLCINVQAKTLVFDHWKTANGVKVYYVKAMQVPMLDIKMAFKAGSAYDGKDWGLAKITNELLNQNAAGMNATQVAEALENKGAIYGSGLSRDMGTVSLRTLSDPAKLNPSLKVFKQILMQPGFDNASIARAKSQLLTYLKHLDEVPSSLADKTFYLNLYGKHPYAHNPAGTPQTLSTLSRNKIKTFYRTHYVSDGAVITLVGAISKKKAQDIATMLTQDLPKASTDLSIPVAKSTSYKLKQIPSHHKQTVIRMGQMGIRYDNPDRPSLIVGNYTLGGGGLVSQLAEEIREKRGLSYYINSYFLPLEAKGPFIVSLATKRKQTNQALQLTHDTIKRFVESGPTEEELTKAKKYLNGSYPLRFLSNKSVLNNLTLLGFYNLPNDYFDTYLDKVNQVTKKSIQAAFKKQVDMKNILTVVVGQS